MGACTPRVAHRVPKGNQQDQAQLWVAPNATFTPPMLRGSAPKREARNLGLQVRRRGGLCVLQAHSNGSLGPTNTINSSAGCLRDGVSRISLGNHVTRTQRHPHLFQLGHFSWPRRRRPQDRHAQDGKRPEHRHERTAGSCGHRNIRVRKGLMNFLVVHGPRMHALVAEHGPAALASPSSHRPPPQASPAPNAKTRHRS